MSFLIENNYIKTIKIEKIENKFKKSEKSIDKSEKYVIIQEIKTMTLYAKPEENAVYYVINGIDTGAVPFQNVGRICKVIQQICPF